MLNKDKLILVAYINVGGIHDADVSAFLTETANNLKPKEDDSILFYVIPVRGEESRLECVNPKLVSEEEYEKAKLACEKISEKLKELSNDES
jgi:hypothetical protein